MTDREIMQQALKALEVLTDTYDDNAVGIEIDAIIALRKRLAQTDPLQRFTDVQQEIEAALTQPEKEPVAWLSTDSIGERYLWFSKPLDNDKAQPLYTAPQKREWKVLTKDEMEKLADGNLHFQLESYEISGVFDLIRAVEAKLKEKNT